MIVMAEVVESGRFEISMEDSLSGLSGLSG